MASQLWIIGVALSLTATLFGTLGKVLLKLSHTSAQAFSVKAAATVCVFLLNPVFDAMSYAYAAQVRGNARRFASCSAIPHNLSLVCASTWHLTTSFLLCQLRQSILAPMAGFSVVWNIVLSPYLLNEKLSSHDLRGTAVILVGCMLVGISGSHDTPTHHSAELFALFKSRIFIQYSIMAVLAAAVVSRSRASRLPPPHIDVLRCITCVSQASVELLAEGGSVWQCAETYLIIASALSSAGGGIYVLDLGLREYDALYLVAIYQAFLILIGSVSGVIFFHEIAGMNSWWQLIVYPFSIVTTVGGIIVLSDKHTEHADSAMNGAINGAKQGEILPLIVSQNGAKHAPVDVV
ncbi:hypothetical protein BBJ28_00011260 [Nothophytophthora sp. Chile5]|nr:hypothetical protein BBJ28_00011260 [Nothophytophthora sp. Chile5]